MSIIILETDRLRLQVPQSSDLSDLIAIRTDPDVMRCSGGYGQAFGTGKIQDAAEITEQLNLTKEYYDTYGLGFFCAFEKQSNAFIGQAGLFHLTYNTHQPHIELAYRLHRCHWGKGYATELATALIDWGFHARQLPAIIAPVHPGNTRSMRVLEKSGMIRCDDIQHKGHLIPCYHIERPCDD